MFRKYIVGALIALSVPVLAAYAATPTLTVSGTGNNTTAAIQVTGADAGAPVILYYNSAASGGLQSMTVGTTDANGAFTGSFTASNGVTANSQVFVIVNGSQSPSMMWPYSSSTSTSTVQFNPTSGTVMMGQSNAITLTGGNGNYYISSNSNANGVTASISGNVLNVYGASQGQASIVVCSTSGGCGTVLTTVNSSSGTNSPTLSQSTMNVTQGSQGSITLTGGSSPYSISSLSGNGVTTVLNGNTLTVNGNVTGTNTLNVCSSNGTSCSQLTVNVQAQTQSQGSGQMAFMIPLMTGQSMTMPISGGSGTGGYYLQTQYATPIMASMSGNMLTVNGAATGVGSVTICQTGNSTCTPIWFTVTQGTITTPSAGVKYMFSSNLSMGMSGTDVMELQNRLRTEGYFTVTPTGYYGPVTMQAVQAYQSAHGISSIGVVGPQTRAMLNQ